MLIQLARAYGVPPGLPSGQLRPNHTILFVSTDGGAYGGVGADWFAKHSPFRNDVAGVINLDSVGSKRAHPNGIQRRHAARAVGNIPADGRGTHRSADRETAWSAERSAPADRSGLPVLALRTGAVPFAGHRRRDTHDRRRQAAQSCQRHQRPVERRQARTDRQRCARRAGDPRRGSRVRAGHVDLRVPRLPPHPWLGGRARADRLSVAVFGNSDRSIRAVPATTYRPCSRASCVPQPARLLGLGRSVSSSSSGSSARGRTGSARPIPPTSPLAGDWPVKGVARTFGTCPARLARRTRAVDPPPGDHGGRGARRTHGIASLPRRIVAARGRDQSVRPPVPPAVAPRLALASAGPGRADGRQVGGSRRRLRRACATARLLRPAVRLGWDTLWYLAQLRGVGYVPFVVMPLLVVWLAGTGQLAALATRRYAPYPAADELPPTGPLRRVVRDNRSHVARSAAAEHRPLRRKRWRARCDGRYISSAQCSRSRACLTLRLGTARLAVARPVHRALHEVEAAPARGAIRQTRAIVRRRRSRERPRRPSATIIAREAKRYRLSSKRGQVIGRIRVPRMGDEHAARQRHRPRHAEERAGT